jgi:hypothetical protein
MRLEISLSSIAAVELLRLAARDIGAHDLETGAPLETTATAALNELLSVTVNALDIQQPHARHALATTVTLFDGVAL